MKGQGALTVANVATVQSRSGRIPMQAIRLDKAPSFAQKYVIRLLYHSHYNDHYHPGLVGAEADPNPAKEVFLSPPQMERADNFYSLLMFGHQQQQLALPPAPPGMDPMEASGMF